jgi:O-antigen biosynthesis protein
MLKDDGERFLPWTADPVVSYEHLHRYLAARALARGRRVLDMASGEGYGSAILAEVGASVVGLDLDRAAVLHADKAYRGAGRRSGAGSARGLTFLQGSITALPLREGSFDLVVCFEALEHVEDQEALCAEAARVLAPGGLFLVSTPNRVVYTEGSGFRNPHHVRELDLGELQALVGRHFPRSRVYGQHVYPVSALFPLDGPVTAASEHLIARGPGEPAFRPVGPEAKAPRYFLCVAAPGDLPAAGALDSYLLDASEQIFQVQRRAEGAVVELERHLGTREAQVLDLERALRERDAQARALLARTQAQDAEIGARDAQLVERSREIGALAAAADDFRRTVAAMEATRTWRLHRRLEAFRARLRRLLGRG